MKKTLSVILSMAMIFGIIALIPFSAYGTDAESDSFLEKTKVVCNSERTKQLNKDAKKQNNVKKEEATADNNTVRSAGDKGTAVEYKTVRNIPSEVTADFTEYDDSTFSNVDFDNPNTDKTYFVNAGSQKAYKVPASSGTFTGQASDDISPEMLKDVFGINMSYGTGYNYTYEDTGYLSIYKNVEIQNTKGTVDQIYSQLEKFADGDNNSLITALAPFNTANKLNTLMYEYTDSRITIMQPGTEPGDRNKSFNMDFSPDDVGAFTSLADGIKCPTNLNWGTNDALALSYEQIYNIANDSNGTYTDNEKALAHKILDQVGTIFADRATNLPGITSNDLADFRIRVVDINGTTGINIIYPSTVEVDKPFPDASAASPAVYENKPAAKAHYNSTDYNTETPKYVYNNSNTYGTSYYIPGDSLEWNITKTTVNADFLRAVFPAADADITALLEEMAANQDREYKITINSSGHLQITHKELIPFYEIKWIMDNGNLIETVSVKEGTLPTYEDPTKAATAEYTYTFTGWSPDVKIATEDAVYTATFSKTKRSYIIKFVNENGDELQTVSVEYGQIPKYTGETPVKEDNQQYTYIFAGWTPEITAVTEETEYKAVFTAEKISYSINTESISWQKDSGKDLEFTVNRNANDNETFNLFVGIEIDGKPVSEGNYVVTKGSLNVKLSADYMNTLLAGEHTLRIIFEDGEVETTFTINGSDEPTSESGYEPIPNTGNTSNQWISLAVLLVGSCITAVCSRKKKEDE